MLVLKKRHRIALRVAIPVLAIAGIGIYAYSLHGLSLRMLYPVVMFLASYLYHSIGLYKLCRVNFILLFPTLFSLYVSFLLWDQSEHLPLGTDMEYPHLAGLAFGITVGAGVLMARALEDEKTPVSPSWVQSLVIFSTVAFAGYAMFMPYAFAMFQAFVEGNHVFVLLAFISVVAFLAFAHSRVPHVCRP